MKYIEESKKIAISVYELVATARRGISPLLPRDDDEPSMSNASSSSESLTYEFESGGVSFLLSSGSPAFDKGSICLSMQIAHNGNTVNKSERAQARGEGYIIYKMLRAQNAPIADAVRLHISYKNILTGELHEEDESISISRAESFFRKCTSSLANNARAEIERVMYRLPSMKLASFPYRDMRAGQSEFIKAVYRAIAKGINLYSEAPTGTGKTVSALFPAIRALGDGRISKVFYFTPKATTAKAVAELINLFSENGVNIRAVILGAKERLCTRGCLCRDDSDDCPAYKENHLTEATFALFDKKLPLVDHNALKQTASDFGTCAHELSLSYSELCDVIICDLNYLFNPSVYIRRFFSQSGDYAFLIDEAHNLPDRSREMYSGELDLNIFSELEGSPLLGEHSELRANADESASALKKLLMPYLKDEIRKDSDGIEHAAFHSRQLPGELYAIIDKAYAVGERAMFSPRNKDGDTPARATLIRKYYRAICDFRRAMLSFDEHYEMFLFLNGEGMKIKLFCIDPSNIIASRLSLGRSSIFFSATMAPIDYYKSTLGGSRSDIAITLPSPFSEEQLAVYVMDKISTRFSERDDTLSAICRVIAATLSAKRGNYMIFSPSFAYSDALHSAFCAKYPKIRTLRQRAQMSQKEREEFLGAFSEGNSNTYLVAFCVMGGIYSEGIDLTGNQLIGAVVVGIGMPALSYEREAISAYYQEKLEEGTQYAYIYPGMNRVLQAAGRVIRTENDRGVIVLIDDRFDDPLYKKTAPSLWHGMKFLADAKELKAELDSFWSDIDKE